MQFNAEGIKKVGNSGDSLCTIPEQFRPNYAVALMSITSAGTPVKLTVHQNGTLLVDGAEGIGNTVWAVNCGIAKN